MCGIVAVLRGPGGRLPPQPDVVLGLLEGAAGDLAPLGPTSDGPELTAGMIAAASHLEASTTGTICLPNPLAKLR